MSYWWVWDKNKIYDSLRKNMNVRGKRWKNREVFPVLEGKMIILEKGVGKNILFGANILPCLKGFKIVESRPQLFFVYNNNIIF